MSLCKRRLRSSHPLLQAVSSHDMYVGVRVEGRVYYAPHASQQPHGKRSGVLRTMRPSNCSRVSTRAPCDFTLASSSFLCGTTNSTEAQQTQFQYTAL